MSDGTAPRGLTCPACSAGVHVLDSPTTCAACGRRIATAHDEHLLVLRTEPDGHRPIAVAVVGEIDVRSAVLLRAELAAATASAPERVEIDLAGVDFIDAQGLGVLVGTVRRAPGCAVVLRSPSPTLLRMLDVTSLRDRFVVQPAGGAQPVSRSATDGSTKLSSPTSSST